MGGRQARGNVGPIGVWLRCAFAFVLATLTSPAGAEDSMLVAGTVRTESLAPAQQRHYSVALAAGQAVELELRQLDVAALELRWHAGGTSPETLSLRGEAGREARLRTTLVAEVATVWEIDLASASGDTAASYAVALGPVHTATPADRERVAAARALAQGQTLQRTEDKQAAPRIDDFYAESIRHAQLANDACGQRLAHAMQSRFDYARGDYRAAQTAAEAAIAQPCEGDLAEQAMALHALAIAHTTQGDSAAAVEAEERALALAKRTGDASRQGAILGNLSVQYRVLGETQKALDAAQAGLAIATATGDKRRAAFIHLAIADVHLARVALAPAIVAYRQALEEMRATPVLPFEGMAWANMGLAYSRSGDNDEAYKAWRKAETICAPVNDWSCLAVVAANRGDALFFDGKLTEAAAEYARALEIGTAHNLKRHAAYALGGLGASDMKAGRWSDARARLQTAHEQMRVLGAQREQAYLATLLGDLDSRVGDSAAARRRYRQALDAGRRYGDRGVQWLALGSLARSAQAAGDLASARRSVESALALIESERTEINDPGLRTSYFTSMRAYYELYIDVLMQLEQREPGKGHATAALIAAERARARSLQEQLAERAIDIEHAIDPALRVSERAAQDHLQTIAYRIARLGKDAGDQRAALFGEIDEASRRLDEARGRIRAANPRYAELAHPVALTREEIQQRLLDDDASVVEYWLGEPRSYLWLVSRKSLHAYTLPARSEIERSVDVLRRSLVAPGSAQASSFEQLAANAAASTATTDAAAQALAAQILPADAIERLGAEVAVVADGGLQGVPFAVLDNAHADSARRFAYLPSLGALRSLRALPRTGAPRNAVAVFADPVFATDDARLKRVNAASVLDAEVAAAASEVGVASLARLPNSREEAQMIAALASDARTRIALDFAANRTGALNTAWSDYAIAHFATHALLNARHPELSGVVLSLYDAEGRAEDGFLRMNDIYNLRMPVELVVLSVCDSALGKSPGSEGAFSLARAFFYAGARRVVASLWPVDDHASAALMRSFYRGMLERGETPALALASAQRELRADPRWRAPYYWAGFVLQGDWR